MNNYINEIKVKKLANKKVYDDKKVALEIERLKSSGITYLDAIVIFCEKHNIEIEEAPKYIHKNILEKLKQESIELKLIYGEPSAKLPF